MKHLNNTLAPLMATLLLSCLGFTCVAQDQEPTKTSSSSGRSAPQGARSDTGKQPKSAEQQARPEIEKQRQQAQQEAERTLDKEAIAAIEETRRALIAISRNKTNEALAAIERATGKINVLLARNPATALIPAGLEVDIIDTAPSDSAAIQEIAKNAARALDDKDYPTARTLLHALMSEIRVRTSNLPLATYPTALREAARLLDQKKTKEATDLLLTALNTLVIVDRVTPIPMLLAKTAITEAQQQRQKDKNAAQLLLEVAKNELKRSKELGYSSNDPEYAALNDEISNLEKQLSGGAETASLFTRLKDRVSAFLKREAERDRAIVDQLTARQTKSERR